MAEPIVLEFKGTCSKKNSLWPGKNGKLHVDHKVKAMLDALALQVPSWARDLNLISPDVTVQQFYTNAKSDRDNAWTSLLDVLVKYKVFKDDCIFHFNGTIITLPAIKAEDDGMTVTIYPRDPVEDGGPPAPRYVDPKRARRLAKMSPAVPATCPTEDLEDAPAHLFDF